VPLIQVTMVQGRTVEQKHALIRSLTAAMHESTGTPTDRIRVAIYEITAEDWGIGGEPFSAVRADPATSRGTDPTTAPTGGTDS
jgi:4-oxalocrotonate tautomerase